MSQELTVISQDQVASSNTISLSASPTPPTQVTNILCDATGASQAIADGDAGREAHAISHFSRDASHHVCQAIPMAQTTGDGTCPQGEAEEGEGAFDTFFCDIFEAPTSGTDRITDLTGGHLPDQHVASVPRDKRTEAEVAKHETDRDALQDFSPTLSERESTKSGAASSSLDAVDETALGPSGRSIASDPAPCRLPGKETDQRESGDETRSDASSHLKHGPDNISFNSPDQGCVVEHVAEARETTATSGDGTHGPIGNDIARRMTQRLT